MDRLRRREWGRRQRSHPASMLGGDHTRSAMANKPVLAAFHRYSIIE
jgi:hypothetical protein